MKLSLTQEKLAAALMVVGRVATTRSPLAVLGNVLLKADKSQLVVIATNLEIAITQVVSGKIDKPGSVTVPARLFSDYVASLPEGTINLESDGLRLKLSSGSYSSTLNGVDAEEFPTIPSVKKGRSFSVGAGELKTALQQTVFAASGDETRPVLTGVLFYTDGKKVVVAATDSYRLAEKTLKTKSEESFRLIVPASALSDMLRIIGDGGGSDEVTVTYDEAQVQFEYGNSTLITKQIDGNFPEYQQLIPKTSDVSFVLNKDELMNITKVAALFARESAGSITLEVGNNAVSITSVASQVGENTSTARAEVEGEGKVTLNSRYLIDALNVIGGKQVAFRFSGSISPCVLTDTGDTSYQHIIMPLKS